MPNGQNELGQLHQNGAPGDANVLETNGRVEDSGRDELAVKSDEPIVTPNAPSEPVWSLSSQQGFERSRPIAAEPPPAPIEIAPKAAPIAAPAEPAAASNAAEEPPRKGWWQRPFRLRD